MSAPGIRLEGVSYWYGDVLGLADVSADLGPGVTGLLGPNGSGKSTLMKLVCGMLRPRIGRVTVAGLTPFSRPSVMRRVGLCPEQDAFYATASVFDVVTYLTRLQGFPRRAARERARSALVRVGLEEAMHRGAGGYSKGMRQRAKLAQALAHDPDVLVLDEPLNGLDPTGRRDLSTLIKDLGREGRCVLVSSHILHEVQAVARRVLFLEGGRVLADGTVEEIRRELPQHPLTVRILLDRPADLAARLLELDGVRRIERIEDGLEVLSHAPDVLFDTVAAVAAKEGLTVHSMVPMDEDLEAVFRYLTR